MKVIIVDKQEGKLTATFEAQTSTEATILALCSMSMAQTDVQLNVSHPTYPANAAPVERVVFSGFSMPVHEIISPRSK